MIPNDVLLLDLGSYEIKGIFYDEHSNNLIHHKEQETGISNGYINNVFLFQTAVLNLIREVELKVKRKIVNITLLISGKVLNYKILSVKSFKINGVVNQKKIEVIDTHIQNWVKERNGILLKSFPVEYVLDDTVVENPHGLYAELFSFKYFICYALKNKLNNLIYLLEELNLNVVDIIPSIFALGERHLSADERNLGSLIFDLGHSKIHWAYYYHGVPLKAGNINFGSAEITNKLARSLKVSLKEAIKIKHEYLSAMLKPDHFCSWVKIIRESEEDFILQAEVIRKILPDVTDFVDEIKKILDDFAKQKKIYHAVFCGNASYLKDLIELLQKGTSIRLKVIKKYDVFDVGDTYFHASKNEKVVNRFYKSIKSFFDYFF